MEGDGADGAECQGFRVTGRVQGVGFRWWATRTAEELGLRGSVRNRADGSVEVHVAGDARAVAAFRERLTRGPAGARVQGVERVESRLPIPDGDFRIVR